MGQSLKQRAIERGLTDYSDEIDGDEGNHGFTARFDVTAGDYVGISQKVDDEWTDRVLLSPTQFKALRAFLAAPRRW